MDMYTKLVKMMYFDNVFFSMKDSRSLKNLIQVLLVDTSKWKQQ